MKIHLAGLAIVCVGLSTPAQAQFNGGMDWVVNRTRVPAIIQCPGCDGDDEDAVSEVAPDVPMPNFASLEFSPSMQRRKQNLSKIAKDVSNNDPATVALLQNGDVVSQIDQMMGTVGLTANNVADAYALWWVAAWEAVNKRDAGSSSGMYGAVKQQASNALLATPAFSATNDAQKQEMAEALLIQAALIDGHIDAAAGNASQQTALANAVNQGAKKMGLDLTRMDLTENGFVPRSGGRSDASDAVEGADPSAAPTDMAANDDAGADESDTGKLALYGVGGVALLAGMFALGKSFGGKG